jgi:hypothetical protein
MNRLLFAAALSFAAIAGAQTHDASPDAVKASRPTTVIDFESETIEGRQEAPQIETVTARPGSRGPSLLRVREDFREKVLESASEL